MKLFYYKFYLELWMYNQEKKLHNSKYKLFSHHFLILINFYLVWDLSKKIKKNYYL